MAEGIYKNKTSEKLNLVPLTIKKYSRKIVAKANGIRILAFKF